VLAALQGAIKKTGGGVGATDGDTWVGRYLPCVIFLFTGALVQHPFVFVREWMGLFGGSKRI
jgi:hypothetical protein